MKIFMRIVLISQNIDGEYTLQPPRRGSSNEYNVPTIYVKDQHTPVNPSFTIEKWSGYEGVYISLACNPDKRM